MPGDSGNHGLEAGVRQAVRRWRDSLVDQTGTNRLLNLNPSRAGLLVIARPQPGEVLARLRNGQGYRFRALQADPPAGPGAEDASRHLDVNRTAEGLARTLRGLHRRSAQAYLDQGLSVLYLAFGTLNWTDAGHTAYRSPLLLVPVRLAATGPATLPVLTPTEDDTVVNPALALKLDQFGVALPAAQTLETLDEADGSAGLKAFFDQVRAAVAARGDAHRDWTVTEDLTLSCFSFAREAMYRDLLDNEDLIAGHKVVRALAGVSERFAFDEIGDRDIDEQAPAEEVPLILDADSAQRACVAAALAGQSFVIDGPPGTGKSQTIANIIGVLLRAGKTVLFVSPKAAALDVVRDRLADRGLGPYLLELHSAKATRGQVADELARTLATEPVPPGTSGGANPRLAATRRSQLSQYADAMNRRRDPFGRSLHDVIGRIALLREVPAAPLPVIDAAGLTAEGYREIMAAARVLSGAWRPAGQGTSFAWRDVTERGPLDFPLQQAYGALATLSVTRSLNRELAEATGLTRPSDAPAFAALLDHLTTRPAAVPGSWLTTDRLASVGDAITRLDCVLTAICAATDEATRAAGTEWQAIPQRAALPGALPGARPGTPPDGPPDRPEPAADRDVSDLRADEITALVGRFHDDADLLADRAAALASLARMLGLRPPVTFAAACDVLSLARLPDASAYPERLWLTPDGHTCALAAADALRAAAAALASAEAAALTYYTPQALDEDAAGLGRRLTAHHGLGKLSAGFRADKKTLASFTVPGVSGDVAQRNLGLVVAWQDAARSWTAAEQAHAQALGGYYAGRATDFTVIAKALRVAQTALRLLRGQDASRVADYLRGRPDTAFITMVAAIARDVQAWRSAGTTPLELARGSIADAVAWLRAQRELLATTAAVTRTVSDAVGRPLTAGTARTLVTLRDAVDAAYDQLAALDGGLGYLLGGLYTGPRTDRPAVGNAYAWVCRLRELIGGEGAGPLTEAQARATATARTTPGLGRAAAAWQSARDSLLAAFGPERQASLSADLDDYAAAEALIKALRQDPAGQQEWHAYQQARTTLGPRGLGRTVAFCVTQRVPAEQVAPIIERATLQGWADDVLRSDRALSVVRAAERDALVDEYRQLDEALIENAAGDIVGACNTRRQRAGSGESAIIAHEAAREREHRPVRTLLERTGDATLAVKPCFMMSPLTVSQFLPPDLRFDVVIVDEASQVRPGDAVSSVYRASSLILAGDQRQLPPAGCMFGSGGADDGDDRPPDADDEDTADFESVLDLAQGAGVFRSLRLRWHRRSRHEALIAFANFSFYQGEITTFPGAGGDGPDVGVELFPAPDGVGRRVAERVMHHYATRPGMSLGVVAFSEAQAAAVETAVTAARAERPELEPHFNQDDRLRGFFVKSLETIQGDERDVLILSIGDGPDEHRPDEHGGLTMNFGPLVKPGGWRRLNVAITRARYRNEIVSSIRAGDIREPASPDGVRHLRRYLDYAERGLAALALDEGSGDAGSPFAESVINAIRSWGYEVTPRVGTGGYRIDIGVRHPGQPGAFCLGVECDGYQYHSSAAARDRDRLRAEALHALGWRLHRIWGTAWYRNRHDTEIALRAAIDRAACLPVAGPPDTIR